VPAAHQPLPKLICRTEPHPRSIPASIRAINYMGHARLLPLQTCGGEDGPGRCAGLPRTMNLLHFPGVTRQL